MHQMKEYLPLSMAAMNGVAAQAAATPAAASIAYTDMALRRWPAPERLTSIDAFLSGCSLFEALRLLGTGDRLDGSPQRDGASIDSSQSRDHKALDIRHGTA